MKRIAIIGSSGFYGRAMVREFRKHHPSALLLGIDQVDPPDSAEPDQFVCCDVRSKELRDAIVVFDPDTVLHFAFVVNPIRDDSEMHDINVGGTKNVMKVVAEIQPDRFLISSSATAYGAWDDNPVPMGDSHPVRSRKEYRYASDKVEVEELLNEFSKSHPGITVSWTRPTIIYEKGVKNYLTTFITSPLVIAKVSGNDTEMQYVHCDDLVAATRLILETGGRGSYNVAPDDWITLSELAEMSNRKVVSIPLKLCLSVAVVWWTLGLPLFRFPAGLWYFIRYPWVISPERLTNEIGYTFQYSSRETMQLMLDDLRG